MDNAQTTLSVNKAEWFSGPVPLTVVLITLNEAHNLRRTFENLQGWAHSVIIVDSYSQDSTIDLCLEFGVRVVQRKFDGFGSHWNFAIQKTGISTPWTMKLDPDEIVTDQLKDSIAKAIAIDCCDGLSMDRQLYFIGEPLPIVQNILRVWKTGSCHFTDVPVNEHPFVSGDICHLNGILEHHDSPNLHHWFNKQNFYTTLEANNQAKLWALADKPNLFGTRLQRIAWIKRNFWKIPFRYQLLFLYNYFVLGSYKAGRAGLIWAKLRSFVYWQWEIKYYEISKSGRAQFVHQSEVGQPDPRVQQF